MMVSPAATNREVFHLLRTQRAVPVQVDLGEDSPYLRGLLILLVAAVGETVTLLTLSLHPCWSTCWRGKGVQRNGSHADGHLVAVGPLRAVFVVAGPGPALVVVVGTVLPALELPPTQLVPHHWEVLEGALSEVIRAI